jgi:hypothetical protein
MKTARIAALLAALFAGGTRLAHAGEVDLALGLDAADSDWDDDRLAYGSFKAGYRFDGLPWFQLTYIGKLGYGTVDERQLTYLSLGPEVRPALSDAVRPYLRGTVVHQHEENVDAAQEQPFQALAGVGDGIRHRAGVAGALGVEFPFAQHLVGDFYASLDLSATYFPDDRGPHRYLTAGVSIGFKWDLDPDSGPPRATEVADARR